jgi:hypothetical protein
MAERLNSGDLAAETKASQGVNGSESSKCSCLRSFPSVKDLARLVGMDERRRLLREAEKADKVMHLICWGPK